MLKSAERDKSPKAIEEAKTQAEKEVIDVEVLFCNFL